MLSSVFDCFQRNKNETQRGFYFIEVIEFIIVVLSIIFMNVFFRALIILCAI